MQSSQALVRCQGSDSHSRPDLPVAEAIQQNESFFCAATVALAEECGLGGPDFIPAIRRRL
jgi:hypothetical protein